MIYILLALTFANLFVQQTYGAAMPQAKPAANIEFDEITLPVDGRDYNLDMLDGIHDFTYKYPRQAGEGVDVYVIDTGFLEKHEVFKGRAKNIGNFVIQVSTNNDDRHGTHVAGIVAKVARKSNIYGIQVLTGTDLSKGGEPLLTNPWWAKGIRFATEQIKKNGRKAVINISIGANAKLLNIQAALKEAAAAGIPVVVAAGNDNVDACGTTPSFEDSVISVGNARADDTKHSTSNWGSCVDIMAPGDNIYSADDAGPREYARLTGTSMAAPHVAGIAAILLSMGVPASNLREELLRITTKTLLPADKQNLKVASMDAIQNVVIPKN